MMESKLLKKAILFIALIFLFYISYIFKNFQFLLISISFLILFCFSFKKINKNILIVLFSFIFISILIEYVLLFANNKKIIKFESKKNISKTVKYKRTYLGYQPLAGIQQHKIVSGEKIIIDSKYTIGVDNFRITPEVNSLTKNKTINFFGGSFIFGWGLNDNETLPYFVQKYFKNSYVKNYGVNGYGVHQMLAQIEKNKKVIEDINILVTFKYHVPRSSCRKDYSFGTPKYILKETKILRKGFCNYGLGNIQIPRIIGSIFNRSQIKILLEKLYYKKKTSFNEEDVELYLSIIFEINKIITKQNKLFFVGYIITERSKIDDYILSILNKNNIKVIDLSLDMKNSKYRLPDKHPSKEANIKRSLIIQNYLKDYQ